MLIINYHNIFKHMIYWVDMSNNLWNEAIKIVSNTQNSQHQTVSPNYELYRELFQKIETLEKQNQQLKKQVFDLKLQKSSKVQRKVNRRPENQLNKNLRCLFPHCKKEYASQMALNLHLKLKHNSGTKKERDEVAKTIVKARMEGKDDPKTNINFPPGYIEKFEELYAIN